jgi:hypothetical protein
MIGPVIDARVVITIPRAAVSERSRSKMLPSAIAIEIWIATRGILSEVGSWARPAPTAAAAVEAV